MPGAPRLTDGIVVLRALTLGDVAVHLAGEDDEHAKRFGWFPQRSTEETVRAAIVGWANEWETGGATRTFGTEEAASGDLVGGCELRLRADARADVSYWTFPDRRGRGFATRAVRLLCEYAFRELGVEEIAAQMAVDNVASRRVAEAAGFSGAARKVSREPGASGGEARYVLARPSASSAAR